MDRKKKSKAELFIELAQPDENGCSRWVDTSEFTGEYERLKLSFVKCQNILSNHRT